MPAIRGDRARPAWPFAYKAAAVAGFVSTSGQILALRETATLFSGYEPALGAVLAGWLFWVAVGSAGAAWALRAAGAGRRAVRTSLSALLAAIGVAAPGTVLALRAARLVWSVPVGELPSLGKMLAISWTSGAPFCLASGALFSVCWAAAKAPVSAGGAGRTRPAGVYVAEALGAAASGILFFAAYSFGARLLDLGLAVGWAAVGTGAWSLRGASSWKDRCVVGLCVLALGAASLTAPALETASRGWLWSTRVGEVAAVRETAFQNLTLTSKDGQYTLFAGGAWAFSLPDALSAEHNAHPALLQHPAPRSVLCIGGDFYGLAAEAFKHATVQRFDYVDPDPGVLRVIEERVPAGLRSLPSDVALFSGEDAPCTFEGGRTARVFHSDAAAFVREAGRCETGYDVILSFAGEPLNAQRNRFYTVEFFQRARQALGPEGVFSCSLPAGLEAVGQAQAQQLRRAYATLSAVFPAVAVLAGEDARFFASPKENGVTDRPALLISRMRDRGLALRFLRPDILLDMLNPFKADYYRSLLKAPPLPAVNRDFAPACFSDSVALWSLQAGWRSGPHFWREAQARPWLFWCSVLALSLVFATRSGGAPGADRAVATARARRRSVSQGVFLAGGAGMALEVGLLLGYQILEGELHSRLALFVASYMAGMGWGGATGAAVGDEGQLGRRLLLTHALLTLAVLAAPAFLWGMRAAMDGAPRFFGSWAVGGLFSLYCVAGGWLGGRYFALAVAAATCCGGRPESGSSKETASGWAGLLYGVDTLGAAAASLLIPLGVIPLYGVNAGFAASGAVCLGGWIGLWRTRSRGSTAG